MEQFIQMANGAQYPVTNIGISLSIYDNGTYRVYCDYVVPSVDTGKVLNTTTLTTFKSHAEAAEYLLFLTTKRIVN